MSGKEKEVTETSEAEIAVHWGRAILPSISTVYCPGKYDRSGGLQAVSLENFRTVSRSMPIFYPGTSIGTQHWTQAMPLVFNGLSAQDQCEL